MNTTHDKVRTTVRIPRPLYDELRRFVPRDEGPSDSINDFFVRALTAYLRLLKRKEIDAAFAEMGKDSDYQKEAELIAAEFSHSDWEAFELAERKPSEV